MPSVRDVYDLIVEMGKDLKKLHQDNLDLLNVSNEIHVTLNNGFTSLSEGLSSLIAIQHYSSLLLSINNKQNDTMLCFLTKLNKNICLLLSESHLQTQLQSKMSSTASLLKNMYEFVHPDARLDIERLRELEKEIHKCCPPERSKPFCTVEECSLEVQEIGDPPKMSYQPFRKSKKTA